MVNQLNTVVQNFNNEQTTKTFKGTGGKNTIVEGKLPYDGGYGSLYYDADGVPRILIGIDPNGDMTLAISKDGQDVLDAF
jgi:hypothetical protein